MNTYVSSKVLALREDRVICLHLVFQLLGVLGDDLRVRGATQVTMRKPHHSGMTCRDICQM